jgi:hypothetical protein
MMQGFLGERVGHFSIGPAIATNTGARTACDTLSGRTLMAYKAKVAEISVAGGFRAS